MEELSVKQRNIRALICGIIIGIYYIILETVSAKFVGNMMQYQAIRGAGYLMFLVLIGVSLFTIRKSKGGYLEFRDAFGATAIIVMVSGFIYYVYRYAFVLYIDPSFPEKFKQSTLELMRQQKKPEYKIAEAVKNFDEQAKESEKFNLARNIVSYFTMTIRDCVPGMVVALLVKKNKPTVQ